MRHRIPTLLVSLAILPPLLGACSGRTDVSVTGNTPAQYSHVYITTQELWFNSSATAEPADGGWVKFPLSTPTTVDLVQENGGNLGTVVTDLKLLPGTYSQVRLIPVDASMALTSSAQSAGALYNAEADYVDSSGTTHQLPLELLNPDVGIGIQASLKVPIGSVGGALSSANLGGAATGTGVGLGITNGTLTGNTNGTLTGTTNGTLTGTTNGSPAIGIIGTGTSVTTGSTTTNTAPNNEFAINILGTTDLVPFTYGTSSTPGIMLSSHASAYDLTKVAGITGQLTLTNLTGTTSTSGLPAIQATAETLSADGSRYVAVASAPVSADGTFLIYPLASSSSTPVYYDVVIHGPGIATIIIQAVDVELASSSTSSTGTATTTGGTATTTTTTGSTTIGTTAGTTTSSTTVGSTNTTGTGTTGTVTATTTTGTTVAVASVSVGTLYPRSASTYTANLATAPAETLPAGSLVGFYQTLGGAGQVPHLIEASPIDPFNEVLANPQSLSAGTIDSGTWTSTDASVNVVSVAPVEGAGGYTVSATAPSFAGGPLSARISAPTSSSTTTPVTVTIAAPTLASGTTAGTLSVAVHEGTPGKYNHGELLVSQNGQLVATASLDAAFTTGAGSTITVSGLPAQTPTALYYLSVRAWNSSDPATTLQRQWYPAAVDLRSSHSATSELTVN